MSFTANRPYVDNNNDFTPINDMVVVVPADATDLPGGTTRALILTGAGTITVVTAGGTTITLTVSEIGRASCRERVS